MWQRIYIQENIRQVVEFFEDESIRVVQRKDMGYDIADGHRCYAAAHLWTEEQRKQEKIPPDVRTYMEINHESPNGGRLAKLIEDWLTILKKVDD